MAIIKCPNCGHVVSDKADRCPNCGSYLQQPVNQFQNQQGYQQLNGYQQQGYQSQANYSQPQRNFQPSVCPKTWMVESILVTLFCCLPFGIVGIVNASKVSSKFASGLYDEAQMASKNAGRFTSIGFWCGLVGIIIYVILAILAGAASVFNS